MNPRALFSLAVPRNVRISDLFTAAQLPAREVARNPVASELLELAEIQRMQRANDEWVARNHPAVFVGGKAQ